MSPPPPSSGDGGVTAAAAAAVGVLEVDDVARGVCHVRAELAHDHPSARRTGGVVTVFIVIVDLVVCDANARESRVDAAFVVNVSASPRRP